MMINKIVKIHYIGCFRKHNAYGDITFRKLNLIYAENGRGKTTLCAILRSLKSGNSEFITERKTLGADNQPYVYLNIDNDYYKFENNQWGNTFPDIIIFDPIFVNENVHSGDYVEHEQRKNFYRVIVGEHGVNLSRKIDDLDDKIRILNADIRERKELIIKEIPNGISIENYLKWEPIEDIDIKIKGKEDDLKKYEKEIERSSEIQSKGYFQRIILPEIPSNFKNILARQLNDIEADAELKVRNQIKQHQMGHKGESWLSEGLEYVKNDLCPFCGQDLKAIDLIKAYRSYFSKEYNALKQEVSQLTQSVNDAIGETAISNVQRVISNNQILEEFWKQFIAIDLPEIPFIEIQTKFRKLNEKCLELVTEKQNKILESVSLDDEFNEILSEIEAVKYVVNQYNEKINKCNALVKEKKDSVQRKIDIETHKNDLMILKAHKRRFEDEIVEICQPYKDSIEQKDKLVERKNHTRQLLDEYCEEILHNYEQSINDYLDLFNTGFRIVNSRHLYTGGTPSSHYQIEINGNAVELGDARTLPGTPSFKTTLSSGDRNALALAFFLSVVDKDPNIENKIVIFDDPFNSLDRFRRTCTQQLIQRLSLKAKQVIVLSHDPYFLKKFWDEGERNMIKTLSMTKSSDTTIITEWDVEEDTQSEYIKNYRSLHSYYIDRKGESRLVVKSIRPFLEGLYRVRFPGHFSHNEWLGDFIKKIRESDHTSGLQNAKTDIDELDAINSYSKKYYHDQNPNADSEPISEDELHSYVKRTLRLVGGPNIN